MPIYDFACNECSHVFEGLVKMGEPTKRCPSCGERTFRVHTFHPPMILFQGDGFYTTDANLRDFPDELKEMS
jgi:putative FmdB family regulatory protein